MTGRSRAQELVSWCGEKGGPRGVPGQFRLWLLQGEAWGCPYGRAARGAGSREVRCLCWARVGTGCRNSLSKGAEEKRPCREHMRTHGVMLESSRKVGLCLFLMALTAGKEV